MAEAVAKAMRDAGAAYARKAALKDMTLREADEGEVGWTTPVTTGPGFGRASFEVKLADGRIASVEVQVRGPARAA